MPPGAASHHTLLITGKELLGVKDICCTKYHCRAPEKAVSLTCFLILKPENCDLSCLLKLNQLMRKLKSGGVSSLFPPFPLLKVKFCVQASDFFCIIVKSLLDFSTMCSF